jgi:hypothetical protein
LQQCTEQEFVEWLDAFQDYCENRVMRALHVPVLRVKPAPHLRHSYIREALDTELEERSNRNE